MVSHGALDQLLSAETRERSIGVPRIPRHHRQMLAIKFDKLPLIRPGSIVLGISVFERTDYVTSVINRKAGVFVLN